jgi:hypothetical protein
MSFSKTISVVAALGSIFSVGLASWKISEDIKNEQTAPLEQKIQELEKKLEEPEPQPKIYSIHYKELWQRLTLIQLKKKQLMSIV